MSAVDLAPGTRVRHIMKGITGTVDPDVVDARDRLDYPGMVPVQWDGDDAWLTAPFALEVLESDPAASAEPVPSARACFEGRYFTGRGPFTCTLERGHHGDHVATTVLGTPLAAWPNVAAVRYRLGGPVAEPAGPADHRG